VNAQREFHYYKTQDGHAMTPGSAVEFLIWMLIAASVIAIVAGRLKMPYTVSLVLGGLAIGALRLPALSPLQPGHRPDWLTPDVILIVFLPALIFEASVKIDVRHLIKDAVPLLLLANVGVLMAALVTACVLHWTLGLPLLPALLFGSIISATDPISVLALFRDLRTVRRLSLLIECESLLNDGTAVVLFGVVLAGIEAGRPSIARGVGQYLLAVVAAAALGAALGYLAGKVTARLDDSRIEITLSTILAYGSYLLAYHLHISGIIATLAAGLMLGNFGGERAMSTRTRTAMQSFWEYASFVINSLVFLLIGMEVRVSELLHAWRPVLLAIAAVLAGRALSVYGLVPLGNLFAQKIPVRWQHVAVWGGLRGALALALALSLDDNFPYRDQILSMTFGVVVFSILVQGLTMKPLMRVLRIPTEEVEG
jgi:CPA1 family monovalent cation:H+ antiporter